MHPSDEKSTVDAHMDENQLEVGKVAVTEDSISNIRRISVANENDDEENQWEDVEGDGDDDDEEQCERESPPYVEAVEEEQYFSPEPEEGNEIGFHTEEFDAIERKMREDLERNEEAVEAAFKG